jgi:hypothetical protein
MFFFHRLSLKTNVHSVFDLDLQTPFLQMYKNYTANYERAIQILDEYEPKEAVATFMTKCYENPIRAGLNLRAYLIMPIQRAFQLFYFMSSLAFRINLEKNMDPFILQVFLGIDC